MSETISHDTEATRLTLTEVKCKEQHMESRCLSCQVDVVLSMNLAMVDLWHSQGRLSSDMRRAYQHVWSISATRSKAYDHFMATPESEESRLIARVMVARLPSGRAYC